MRENPTPYELRFKLLQMSKDILERRNDNARMKVMDEWSHKVDVSRETGSNVLIPLNGLPEDVSLNSILEMARDLNKFVSHG